MSTNTPSRFAIGPEVRFKAAVAYYPYCEALSPFYAPLMILTGAEDEWTPAERCASMLVGSQAGGGKTVIEVYPDATHAFDYVDLDTTYQGHRLVYNPVAAEDSFRRVEAFFDAYLE
jgi:dienelactone hydrolase